MFSNSKRDKREKSQAAAAGSRWLETFLQTTAEGFFLLDERDKVLPPFSKALAGLFRREDFGNLTFEKLLARIVSAKTLSTARNHITELLGATPPSGDAFRAVEVRLPNPDGSFTDAHYGFDFEQMVAANQVVVANEPRVWLVRVTDITARVEAARELHELRSQVRVHGEMLRVVLQLGAARFGGFMQKADASMKAIAAVLKKAAREDEAFRQKLEEILNEVDRIRREAVALQLSGLEDSARVFEDALQDLRSRSVLSGSDFLPLAVKLDELYGQFALLQSLTSAAAPSGQFEAAAGGQIVTEDSTAVMQAAGSAQAPAEPKSAPQVHRTAPAGSLENTLQSLTDLMAQQHDRQVLLETSGLDLIPRHSVGMVKNVVIQLIRNAVMHGIEPPAARVAVGKPAGGTLRIDVRIKDESLEVLFEDDGRGLVPEQVRSTAVARGLLTEEAAQRMRDREAIKLIFKTRYTTLPNDAADPKAHGTGLSTVRRYVHDFGGKIALASLPAHETRFKITLPITVEAAVRGAAAAAPPGPGDAAAA